MIANSRHHILQHKMAIDLSLLQKIAKSIQPLKIKDFGKRTCFELMTINSKDNFLTFTISQKKFPVVECVVIEFYLSDVVRTNKDVTIFGHVNDYLRFSKFQFNVKNVIEQE